MIVRNILRKVLPKDFRYRTYFAVLRLPVLWELYIRSRNVLRASRVREGTALVIDGFPRSGNSYARAAFEYWNPGFTNISTHLHTPRSVLKGLRLGIPCVLLIRPPGPAAASLVQMLPGLSLESAFRIYSAFYEPLVTVKQDLVIADFEDVSSDFGAVLRKTNDLFGTMFNCESRVSIDQQEIKDLIDSRLPLFTIPNDEEKTRARPQAGRASAASVLTNLTECQARELRRAESAYCAIVANG